MQQLICALGVTSLKCENYFRFHVLPLQFDSFKGAICRLRDLVCAKQDFEIHFMTFITRGNKRGRGT